MVIIIWVIPHICQRPLLSAECIMAEWAKPKLGINFLGPPTSELKVVSSIYHFETTELRVHFSTWNDQNEGYVFLLRILIELRMNKNWKLDKWMCICRLSKLLWQQTLAYHLVHSFTYKWHCSWGIHSLGFANIWHCMAKQL